ncbi:MAG TPA: Asp-tRNA(Asn)/Glu-tRNA(Gln) amidotransferase subunit GatB, partial [Candidatus Saccharimonadales bacterium]|nr:Asp-tRNA(Asn)/Glu-tRNA(Gln) amidotransferase subunit GatB [Candidatus Saccharimonadales bacterium]
MISQKTLDSYLATIGIECHVQLKTKTKLFSGADNDARSAAPNTTVSPICFGLPGTLPVLNIEAVALAIRAGIALNAEIAPISSFDRKHYFYPDLPKGYQITQLERPIVGVGSIDVPQLDGQIK